VWNPLMSFAFTHRKNVEAQVCAIAREQIDKALAETEVGNDDAGAVVHGLRRRCKKLRGLIRLVRPDFDGAEKENAAFRDAAASLSLARDAAVMVETFDGLLKFDRKSADAQIGTSEATDIAAALREQASAAGQGHTDQFRAFRRIFLKARERVKDWSIDGRGFDALGDGLAANYKLFRKRLARAEDEPLPEHLHEWRKAAKYYGHHISLFRRAAPDLLNGPQAAVDALGDLLGDHHNMAVLAETLNILGFKGSAIDVIGLQQEHLAKTAFGLGRQLAAEKPEALRRRFEVYWSLLPEKA
jgi:CHAD domain-containing protein